MIILDKKLIISIVIIKLKSHPFDPLIIGKNNIYSKYKNSEKNKFKQTKKLKLR
jgi:hypothetical protein